MDKHTTRAQMRLILFIVSLSTFMATLDGSIVNIALPVLSAQLATDISSIQWIVTSYLLTISVLLLIWGKIADLYGRKKIFAAGFLVFTIGSALCGMSSSLSALVLSRILQAVGASSMMALSQGIVTETFPPAERGKALGITGTIVAVGSLVGPTLGGILVHSIGWRFIFYINLPIGILGFILTLTSIPAVKIEKENTRFDYIGSVLFIFSALLLFLGLLLYQDGLISSLTLGWMLAVSFASLLIFIRWEGKHPSPLLDLSLFKNSMFTLGLLSAFLVFAASYATIMFLPFYLQYILGMDTLKAGLMMSFYPLATALTAPISGWLSDRVTYKPLTTTGLSINTVIYLLLSSMGTGTSLPYFAVLLILLGIGSGLFQSPNNSSVMGSVARNRLGVAGGINALFRNLGMVSGITLSVLLFSSITRMDINKLDNKSVPFDAPLFLKGYRFVLLTAALVCVMALVTTLTRLRIKPRLPSAPANPTD